MHSSAWFVLLVFLASACTTNPNIRETRDQQTKASKPFPDTVLAPPQVPQGAKMTWQRIPGTPGVDGRYGSGYLDLATPVTFVQGERLRLRIGGTAKKVVVRLLPTGSSPSEAVGIIDTFDIPPDRALVLTLDSQHPQIRQISVHGGPKPWDIYDLGGGNGPATLLSADREAR
jgi:hypothetical protein